MSGPGFKVETYQAEDRYLLVLTGEVDIVTAPDFEAKAIALALGGAKQLVVDLGPVSFMDSTGVNAILNIKAVCDAHACELCLVPGQAQVQRLLEITGLLDVVPSYEPWASGDDAARERWEDDQGLAGKKLEQGASPGAGSPDPR